MLQASKDSGNKSMLLLSSVCATIDYAQELNSCSDGHSDVQNRWAYDWPPLPSRVH